MKYLTTGFRVPDVLLMGLFSFFLLSLECLAGNVDINRSIGINKKIEMGLPEFTAAEIYLIKTLSSQNYVETADLSNRVSGNSAAIALGQTLFFDTRLSGDGLVSCSTCHNPAMSWSNHEKITSLRAKEQAKKISTHHIPNRHIPSLWGVRYNRWYYWDGRADSLWSQAIKPIEDKTEMASNRVQLAQLIINTPSLRKDYEQLFGVIPSQLLIARLPASARPVLDNEQDPDHQAWLTLSDDVKQAVNRLLVNIGKSIAAFEETLISRHSQFDYFADHIRVTQGKNNSYQRGVMSVEALRGLKLFIGKAGCTNCHFGPNFSDGEFHHSFLIPITLKGDLGRYEGVNQLLNDPFNGKSLFSDIQKGQRNKLDYVYQNVEFRGQFKTPSLRNVAQTYPYMHTGEFKTLKQVLQYYNRITERMTSGDHQEILLKSLNLSDKEIDNLVAFLKSLSELEQSSTDQLREKYK